MPVAWSDLAREPARGQPQFSFVEGNAVELPVPDAAFDEATFGFGAIVAPVPRAGGAGEIVT